MELVSSAEPCEVCGGTERAVLHRSVRIGRCRNCSLVSLVDKPSEDELLAMYSSVADYEGYVEVQRTEVLDERYVETLHRLQSLLPERAEQRQLFDVGAGAGAFLARAAEFGFRASGNEISSHARQMCSDRHGIQLSELRLDQESGSDRFDVITMWCVLAHVTNTRETLESIFRLLRPGGILYFHTPRWCAIDSTGMALIRLSRGKFGRMTRRRIGMAHMRLYNGSNLTRQLESVGFDVVTMQPKTAFSLRTPEYLRALGVPRPLRQPVGRGLDVFINRGLFPRNILDVYVRKPLVGARREAPRVYSVPDPNRSDVRS